jgi:hypothetical protein
MLVVKAQAEWVCG